MTFLNIVFLQVGPYRRMYGLSKNISELFNTFLGCPVLHFKAPLQKISKDKNFENKN